MKGFLGQTGPFVINYRINAGYISPEHWTQDNDIGGGRIIGEICHFVDYLQFITGSKPVKVFAESIRSTEKYKTDDNVIAVINFGDGSVGNITYTSQGSKAYPREIIEVFRDESVYYLEDFKVVIKVKDGTRKKMTVQPMYPFVYDEDIPEEELKAKLRKILKGERDPKLFGPMEYKIVAEGTTEDGLLLAD